MIEIIRQQMERDAAREGAQAAVAVRNAQRQSLAHHLILLSGAFLGFTVIYLSIQKSWVGTLGGRAAWIGTLMVIVLAEFFRPNQKVLRWVGQSLDTFVERWRMVRATDFLVVHYWVSIALIWIPFTLWSIDALIRAQYWIFPGDPAFLQNREHIAQAFTYSAGLLGAQLTLFTFILSHVLGRYSGSLASAIIWHRSIVALVSFGVLSLGLLGIAQIWGYPQTFSSLPHVVIILCFPALLVSVFVSLGSINTEQAIIYAGKHFANRLRRRFKGPWPHPENISWVWRALASYGLALRSPDRISPLIPPARSVNEAIVASRTLFNAANISLQAGQEEALGASLSGLVLIANAYVERRKAYYAADDLFFSYLNDQMAALMGAAVKASNQQLLTNVVSTAGMFGYLSLKIGHFPKDSRVQEEGRGPKGHSLVIHWIGILKEAFLASHTLLRTSAPFEALSQLKGIAGASLRENVVEVVTFTYLPTLQEIQRTCLVGKDSYYMTLAGQCLRDLLMVWYYPILQRDCGIAIHYTHERMLTATKEMALLQMAVRPGPTFDFSDAPNVLTGRTASDTVILQDIFFALAHRERSEAWEHRACVDQLKSLFDLIAVLGCVSAKGSIGSSQYFAEAFYEMAYFVLRGVPGLPLQGVEELEKSIFKTWIALYQCYRQSTHPGAYDADHSLFAALGLASALCAENGRSSLKTQIISGTRAILEFVRKEASNTNQSVPDETWDYLQLVGAWTKGLLGEDALAEEIIVAVSSGRPFVTSAFGFIGSSGGPLSSLGYPTIMHHDYFFPNLLHSQQYLNKDDWKRFHNLQSKALAVGVLSPFAEEIERRRGR
ncbi:MAG: hypothetical protein HYT79_03135 [Elusimicrobia bacterium]|nr:hypothetical protein [Elusimicrobiota bacterium]